MTQNLLGLSENPFAAGHDARLLLDTPERQEIADRIVHGLSSGEPFVLVTGESGVGKTSVVQRALEGFTSSSAVITHPSLTRDELLEEICIRFEVELPEHPSKPVALSRLEQHLGTLRELGERPVLVLDEAHELDAELLEELRLLSNHEAQGQPMLQMVLVGLPEIERRLGEPRLAQLQQRIATHCRVAPLLPKQTEHYIHHRIAVAGGEGVERFPPETCLEIHRFARGVPRAINTLAGQAILRASRDSARAVTPIHVQAAIADSWVQTVSDGSTPVATTGGETEPPAPAAGESAAHPVENVPREPRSSGDPDVKAWVSKFVDPSRPVRIGASYVPEGESLDAWPDLPGGQEGAEAVTAAPAGPGSGPSRRARKRAPRHAGKAGRGMLAALASWARARATHLLAVAALLVLAAAALVLFRPRGADPEAPVATSVEAVTPSAPPTLPAPISALTTVPGEPAPVRAPAAPRADSAGAAKPPPRRLGVEVSSYIDPERARERSTTLSELTGLSVRVLEGEENGFPVYRVVLGSFGSRRRAEQAADDLLAQGLVDQARIITLPSRARP